MKTQSLLYLLLLIIIGLFLFILAGCKPNFDDCYTCKKPSGGYSTSMGYVTTYTTTVACSDDAAQSLESKGWNCEGYSASGGNNWNDCYDCTNLYGNNIRVCGESMVNHYISLGYTCVNGLRKAKLIAPSMGATYVDLDTSMLRWKAVTDPNGNGNGVSYDVYFGTESAPSTRVSENQPNLNYTPKLDIGTTYYWKIVAKRGDDINESKVSYFKSMPIISHGIFTDNRDGNTYKTVTIGGQVWMAENLAYKIPGKQITDKLEWRKNLDAWCYYDNDEDSTGNIYGILYQSAAAITACPEGWHLPSYEEWEIAVREHLGGFFTSGNKLKEKGIEHWISPNLEATNLSGFTALPAGIRDASGYFKELGTQGSWWNATAKNINSTGVWYLDHSSGQTRRDSNVGRIGCSVRCVKD